MERNSKRLENLSASFNGGENCGQPSRVLLYPYPKERREDWIETLAPVDGTVLRYAPSKFTFIHFSNGIAEGRKRQ